MFVSVKCTCESVRTQVGFRTQVGLSGFPTRGTYTRRNLPKRTKTTQNHLLSLYVQHVRRGVNVDVAAAPTPVQYTLVKGPCAALAERELGTNVASSPGIMFFLSNRLKPLLEIHPCFWGQLTWN